MVKLKFKKIVPIALGAVLAILVLASILSAFFNSRQSVDSSGSEALLGVSAGSAVKMTVRGPIVGDEDFKAYVIEVSPNKRKLLLAKGYLGGQLTELKVENNNLPAYEQLVYALDKANFAKSGVFSGEANDLRGICARGQVYDFQILENNKVVKNYWTSTCKGSPGSLKADLEQVSGLFFAQMKDSRQTVLKAWQ